MTPSPSLLEAWTRTVAAQPTARALIDAGSEHNWTRADIDRAADAWLREHGSSARGQLVALSAPNGSEWLHAFAGLLKSDAVVAPLDPGEPVDAQRTTARQIGATLLWREGQLESLGEPTRVRRDGRRLVKLTSGSTGAPRPLLFRDAELLADGRQVCAGMGIQSTDINLGLIPWGHSYGLGNLILPLLMQGTAIVTGVAPLPHAIAAAIQRWNVTVFPGVPALLGALANSTIPADHLASLRTVISAGAPLAAEVAQAFHARFDRRIHAFYGSSETGGISYDRSGESTALGRGVGRPFPGIRIEFGRGGRFTVASEAVFTLGNRTPGRQRMADIARLTEDGELVLLGRAGRFVKIAGRRLNLAEVEHALKHIPGVRDAWVAPHAQRTDALAAAVISNRPGSEIREALRERLAPWKIPKRIVTLNEFPLTVRGKVDTKGLRKLLNE